MGFEKWIEPGHWRVQISDVQKRKKKLSLIRTSWYSVHMYGHALHVHSFREAPQTVVFLFGAFMHASTVLQGPMDFQFELFFVRFENSGFACHDQTNFFGGGFTWRWGLDSAVAWMFCYFLGSLGAEVLILQWRVYYFLFFVSHGSLCQNPPQIFKIKMFWFFWSFWCLGDLECPSFGCFDPSDALVDLERPSFSTSRKTVFL